MSDTFAANAPVEGWMFTNPRQPKQPVAAIRVHGTKDAYELSGISSRPTRSHEG
jgi:poly(3-hydroxybutyrate) depolymerase